jgi:hypothetical protein
MDTMIQLVKEWSLTGICLRLLLATIVGIIIGLDREYKNKGAGVKTHALVCIGSAMAMIVNEYCFRTFPGSNIDVTRIGAQVISGIGFLGVGTIIITGRNEVRGLTTAAGLWACAGVGLAAGIGFAEGTIVAMIFILLVLRILAPLDKKMHGNSRQMDLYIEFRDNGSIGVFMEQLRVNKIDMLDFEFRKNRKNRELPVAMVSLKLPGYGEKKKFKEVLRCMDEINYFEEL